MLLFKVLRKQKVTNDSADTVHLKIEIGANHAPQPSLYPQALSPGGFPQTRPIRTEGWWAGRQALLSAGLMPFDLTVCVCACTCVCRCVCVPVSQVEINGNPWQKL